MTNSRVAVVTGASRGIGRGVAVALHDASYRVFATGRSIAGADLPGGIVRLPCNHLRDEETRRAFARVLGETDGIDVLANCAWDGYARMVENGRFTWMAPFWEQPLHRWTSMMDAGVRTALVCSGHAARAMIARGRGLIVNLGFWSAQKYLGNAVYGAAKAATDKLTADMAHELRSHGVAVVSLYPGLVRTEAVLEAANAGALDLSNSESPEFIGRVISALYDSPGLMRLSGTVVVAATAARELNVVDIDGTQPKPLTLDTS